MAGAAASDTPRTIHPKPLSAEPLGLEPPGLEPLRLDGAAQGFMTQVERLSGTPLRRCYFCKTCTNGCPFAGLMDKPPHVIWRLVALGLRREALSSSAIWVCVGCHTCSAACPMALDLASVMDALRSLALAEGAPVAEPRILEFHRAVLESVAGQGRANKLEIMLRYKAQTRDWLSDFNLGLRMLAKRKLELGVSRVKDRAQIKRMFQPAWRGGRP